MTVKLMTDPHFTYRPSNCWSPSGDVPANDDVAAAVVTVGVAVVDS